MTLVGTALNSVGENVQLTCLATPFLQTSSHYKTSCFTDVTLSNVSCNLPRFDDHMRLKEQFHWPLRHKLQDRCYTAHCIKNSLQPLRKVKLKTRSDRKSSNFSF